MVGVRPFRIASRMRPFILLIVTGKHIQSSNTFPSYTTCESSCSLARDKPAQIFPEKQKKVKYLYFNLWISTRVDF